MTADLAPVSRALRAVAELRGPAGDELLDWMAPLVSDPGGQTWRSRLGPGGSPVELSFCSATPGTLRWTAEVAPPRTPAADRLAVALRRLGERGVVPPPGPGEQVLAVVARAQGRSDLDWGAWVGARADGQAVRWKLYAEVPPALAAAVQGDVDRLLGRRPAPWPRARLRMLGLDLSGSGASATAEVECYHLVGGLSVDDLGPLGESVGVSGAGGRLRSLTEAVLGRPLTAALPGGRHRVSTRSAPGGPATVSVIAPARHWVGDDPATRARLLDVAALRGEDAGLYGRLTAGCALLDRHTHGLLAVSDNGTAPGSWTASWRPVPRDHVVAAPLDRWYAPTLIGRKAAR